MNMIAFDLGLSLGWAAVTKDDVFSGCCNLKKTKEEPQHKYANFWDTIHLYVPSPLIDLVLYEEVMAHKGAHAAHDYGAYKGMLILFCEMNEIPYEGVHVATIKKHATGNGRASKEEVIAAAEEKYGKKITKSDEADALMLLDWAIENRKKVTE